MISADIKAFIQSSTVTAGSVALKADDTSRIMAFAGSASVAAAFGGVGVGVSIGVALGHNIIENEVAAYISGSTVTSTSGGIKLEALEHSQINAISAAASLGVAVAGVGVTVSGAGAEASNVILTQTNAYIEASDIHSDGNVEVTAKSLSAAPELNDLTEAVVGNADLFGGKLDDADSTDVDKEDGGANERDVDIAADATFLTQLSGYMATQDIMNSGDLAVTIRTKGSAWSITDRITGASYVITRSGSNFKVTAPTIGATVIAASAAISGGGVGVGVSIGLAFARNLIGWELGQVASDYTTGDDPALITNGKKVRIEEGVRAGDVYQYVGSEALVPKDRETTVNLRTQDYGNTDLWRQVNLVEAPAEVEAYVLNSSIVVAGGLNQTAISDQSIDALVVAGSAALSAGTVGVSAAGAGAVAINTITTDVKAFIEGDGLTGIHAGSVSISAEDTSSITAITGAASLAAAFGGVGVAISIGIAGAYNEISNDVAAYIYNADNGVTTTTGGVTIDAVEAATINALTAAASLGVGIGAVGVAVSGAGAGATNIILTRTNAYVANSSIVSAGDVTLDASDSATINATVATSSAALAGGAVGVGVSIGVSVAQNLIGYNLFGTRLPMQVRAYAINSSITAGDDLIQTATANETIRATVLAGSAAISAGAVGVSGSGAGAGVANKVAAEVKSFIENATGTGIDAGGDIVLTAHDTSTISATAGAASMAASVGMIAGSVSVGVAVAQNQISNVVEAYIKSSSVDTTSGRLTVQAFEDATINADSVAASAAISAGLFSLAVSGGGAEATNTIQSSTKAYIYNSTLDVAGNLTVESRDTSTSIGKVGTDSVSAGLLSISAGGSVANASVTSAVDAYTDLSNIDAGGTMLVSAKARPRGEVEALGVNAGTMAVGVSTATSTVSPTVRAFVGGSGKTITAGSLTVTASDELPSTGYSAKAKTTGSAGGLIGVDATVSNAYNYSTVRSFVQDGTTLDIAGATVVNSDNNTEQYVEANSNVGGLVAVGVSTAKVTSSTATEAYLGSGVKLTGGSLSITATGNDDNFAYTVAGSIGGISVSAATATTVNTSTTRAEIRDGSNINLLVPATYDTDKGIKDVVTGDTVDVVGGFNGGGREGNRYRYIGSQEPATYTTEDGIKTINKGDTVDVLSNHDGVGTVGKRYEYVGNDPLVNVNLKTTDFLPGDKDGADLWSDTGWGRSTKAGVDLKNEDFTDASNWLPIIQAGAPGGFKVTADHTAAFNSQVKALAGGLFGGTGAEIDNTVSSLVEAKVGNNVSVKARDIAMDAVNRARKPLLSDGNIDGEAYGIIAGGSADSETLISFTTLVTVGNGASLEVLGSITSPGNFKLKALNDLIVKDKINFTAGGGLSGLGAYSTIQTNNDLSRVQVGDADLKSVGAIAISAHGTADVSAKVNAQAYGLGTLIIGESVANVCPTNEVIIGSGAYVRALGDLEISTGTSTDFVRDPYAVEARLDSFAGSAIPIEDVDAKSYLMQENTITVAAGALLETARSARIHAERYGFGEMTGKAKAVNWVSSLADALNGAAAEEMYAGTVRTESHGIVTIDGTVRTGIMRTWSLTLDGWDKSAGTISASGKVNAADQKIGFTVSQEVLQSDLVKELEKARSQYNLYLGSGNATLVNYYASEIARLEGLLSSEGLLEINGGVSTPVAQYVMTVNIDPVWAEAGSIDIRSDQLRGSGSFDAPGDASVTILNHTPAFVVINGITIPENNGGLFFNGQEVTQNAPINTANSSNADLENQINDDEDARKPTPWGSMTAGVASFSALPDNALSDPFIHVENDFVAGTVGGDVYAWPDITVVGAVNNLSGSVTFKTHPAGEGDIVFSAAVRAKNMTVIAGGTVYIDGVSSYSVGGEAASLWNSYLNGGITAAKGNIFGVEYDYTDDILGLIPAGVNLYGDKIFINAEYLNINGIMQSGKSDYILNLGAATISEIASINPWQRGQVVLKTASTDDFIVRFDTATRQIVVDEMRVSGGQIELTGHIMNTGTGEIRVLGGYAKVEVNNGTPYDLVINRLDASQRGAGTLLIVDKAKDAASAQTVSLYRMSGERREVRTVGQTGRDAAVVSTLGTTDTYTPADGWRYGWSVVQKTGTLYTSHVQKSAWLGIDALAADAAVENNSHTEPLGQPVIKGTGPYFYKDASITENYTYDFSTRVTSATDWQITNRRVDSTWYGKKTYHSWWAKEQTNENNYTHTIESDRSFAIKFIGYDQGQVNVDSVGNVVLEGPVLNPSGTTVIKTDGAIRQTGDAAYVNGLRVELTAKTGIGSDSAINTNLADEPVYQYTSAYTGYSDTYEDVSKRGKTTLTTDDRVKLASNYTGGGEAGAVYRYTGNPADLDLRVQNYGDATKWAKVNHRPSLKAVTTAGKIQINELIGTLAVDQVATGQGADVSLTAQGGITVAQKPDGTWYDGLVQGGGISLIANGGGIGNDSSRPLKLDSGTLLKDNVSATAMGNVFLKETAGNLRLKKIDAAGHDVEVAGGGIVDANQAEERDERTYNELKEGMWKDLQLTDTTGAQDKIDNIVASFAATKEGEYRTYWVYRNSVGGSYDASQKITLSATERAWYEDYYAGQGKTATEIAAAITTLENSRTTQYHTLHGQFDDYFASRSEAFPMSYDPAFSYVLSASEESTLRASVKVWTEEELLYAIGAGLLKPVTDTQGALEDPNIVGANVTLVTSGGVGNSAGRVEIDLSGGALTLTDDQRVALAAAERDDVGYWGVVASATVDFKDLGSADQIVRKDGDWTGFAAGDRIRITGSVSNNDIYRISTVSGSTLTLSADDALVNEFNKPVSVQHEILDPLDKAVIKSTITIDQREDVDVESSGEINITAGANVYLGSEGDLNIDSVHAGDTVRIKGGQGIYNVAVAGAANVVSGDLVLEAAEKSLGTAAKPFTVNLDGTSTVTARAGTDIYLTGLVDTLYVGTLYARSGGIHLTATGAIADGYNNDFENIRANTLELTAGAIGEAGDYLDVNLLGTGTLKANASGTIRIAETEGNLYVNRVSSSAGDVDLKAHLSILDANNDIAADVIGKNITLNADVGGIGVSGNDLDIDTLSGLLNSKSNLGNAYIIETGGDVILDTGQLRRRLCLHHGAHGPHSERSLQRCERRIGFYVSLCQRRYRPNGRSDHHPGRKAGREVHDRQCLDHEQRKHDGRRCRGQRRSGHRRLRRHRFAEQQPHERDGKRPLDRRRHHPSVRR